MAVKVAVSGWMEADGNAAEGRWEQGWGGGSRPAANGSSSTLIGGGKVLAAACGQQVAVYRSRVLPGSPLLPARCFAFFSFS